VVCVRYDLVLGHELVTADDQMRLHDEIQIPQHLPHPLWTFDFNFPVRMTQLDDHKAILRPAEEDCKCVCRLSERGRAPRKSKRFRNS